MVKEVAGEVAASWEQFECLDVAGADDGEVRPVEGEDLSDVKSFGDRDDAGVGGAEARSA